MSTESDVGGLAQNGSDRKEDHGKSGDRGVNVHVKHLGEHEKENFKVPLTWTLQQIWDQAYIELKIAKTERDVFQAPSKSNPIDLTPHLALTFEEAQRRKLCDKD